MDPKKGYQCVGLALRKKQRVIHRTHNTVTADHGILPKSMSSLYYQCPTFSGFHEHTSGAWTLPFRAKDLQGEGGCMVLSKAKSPAPACPEPYCRLPIQDSLSLRCLHIDLLLLEHQCCQISFSRKSS